MKKADLIDIQRDLASPLTVKFDDGAETVLSPASWLPEVHGGPRIDLDGPWQCTYWPFPVDEADEKILAAGGGTSPRANWRRIRQPGKIFYYDPRQSPDSIPNWNRVSQEHLDAGDGAIILRHVDIPASWAGKRIALRFEGIYPAGHIYWDDELIARHYSGLTPIELDVTDRAEAGRRHVLAVRFFRRHPAIRLDMPRHALDFVGLCRSAFVHALEPVHLSDIRIDARLADDFAAGSVRGELTVRNLSPATAPARLDVTVADDAGRVVAARQYEFSLAPKQAHAVALDVPAGAVRQWNAERPCLYTLSTRLECIGQACQEYVQRIGFRRLDFVDGRPMLNGKYVKFRGVNHLTHHPRHGMYTPRSWLARCLTLMKPANVNAIRTHFFGPRELTELCDEMGIYLLQELPLDWGTDYVQDTTLLGPMLHRMAACVRRDRNNPSVMVWSVGNENMPASEKTLPAFNEHLRLCNRMVKTMDPTRSTMFPPPGPANAVKGIFETRLGDIADTHYSFSLARMINDRGVLEGNPRTWEPTFEPVQSREELLKAGRDGRRWNGAWFSSEYGINNLQTDLLNAPYTSIIADVKDDVLGGKNSQQVFIDRLKREWGYMRDDPTCLGGAYFCWIAAGAGDTWGWVRWGEDADWGIVTRDLTPKSFFWAMRAIFSPVVISPSALWRKGDAQIRITVHNGYNGIDLSECTLRTQMGGGPPYMGMLRQWRDVPMAAAPGATAQVDIPIWNAQTLEALQQGRPVVCRCTVLDPTGYRPITADVLVTPEDRQAAPDSAIPIGPDAI